MRVALRVKEKRQDAPEIVISSKIAAFAGKLGENHEAVCRRGEGGHGSCIPRAVNYRKIRRKPSGWLRSKNSIKNCGQLQNKVSSRSILFIPNQILDFKKLNNGNEQTWTILIARGLLSRVRVFRGYVLGLMDQ